MDSLYLCKYAYTNTGLGTSFMISFFFPHKDWTGFSELFLVKTQLKMWKSEFAAAECTFNLKSLGIFSGCTRFNISLPKMSRTGTSSAISSEYNRTGKQIKKCVTAIKEEPFRKKQIHFIVFIEHTHTDTSARSSGVALSQRPSAEPFG